MKIIPYEDDGLHRLTTPCPSGMMRTGEAATGRIISVGSSACIRCTHFITIQRESNEVACSFIADHMDTEKDRAEDAKCSAQGAD